jgi:hypothetical protein
MALVVKDGSGVLTNVATTLDGSGNHQPNHVVTSSVLPSGASTEATLASALSALTSILTQVSSAYPRASTATITSVQTASNGTDWTAFGSASCSALNVANNTGTTLEYRRGGTGSTMPIFDGYSCIIVGIANANEISVRRVDNSTTQVTLAAEALTY